MSTATTPSSTNLRGQFGDTTYTKVFVGGLAWETQKETMKKYFEQFGEILEAVVITDKATGRSKGYGFVTFREAEAARKACVDSAPVIDGRRANCNLASLGVQRSKPSTPNHAGGGGGRNMRVMSTFQTVFGGGVGLGTAAFTSAAAAASSFPPAHYAIQQGLPAAAYNLYGYSAYSPDYTYPTSYYSVYGGATTQYPVYGSGGGGMMSGGVAAAYYPYLQQFAEGISAGASNYSISGVQQYPQHHHHHHLFQYSSAAGYHQHYGAPLSLASTATLPSAGVTMALPAPPVIHSSSLETI